MLQQFLKQKSRKLKTDYSGIFIGDGTTTGSKLKSVSNLSGRRTKLESVHRFQAGTTVGSNLENEFKLPSQRLKAHP